MPNRTPNEGPAGKGGLYKRLVYANLILDWYQEFCEYWVKVLNNRPLLPHDFYFLYDFYRTQFSVQVPNNATGQEHLRA